MGDMSFADWVQCFREMPILWVVMLFEIGLSSFLVWSLTRPTPEKPIVANYIADEEW